jgi:hypothetical protein
VNPSTKHRCNHIVAHAHLRQRPEGAAHVPRSSHARAYLHTARHTMVFDHIKRWYVAHKRNFFLPTEFIEPQDTHMVSSNGTPYYIISRGRYGAHARALAASHTSTFPANRSQPVPTNQSHQTISTKSFPPNRSHQTVPTQAQLRLSGSLRVLTRPYKEEKPRKPTVSQGLTLVHFSAQLERFVWDRGCA